jgi:hypothetical protein
MEALSSGFCMLGREQSRDYYGNTIPSRDDVAPGTKGSKKLVIDNHGRAWVKKMEAI